MKFNLSSEEIVTIEKNYNLSFGILSKYVSINSRDFDS